MDKLDGTSDYFDDYVFQMEKKEITLFNKLEYTPVIGTVIGSAEVLYGVSKIAVEIIRGIGNQFLKKPEYNFKKEFGSGLRFLGRGLSLTLFPIFSGILLSSSDKDAVRRFNHNKAVTHLNSENITEKELDIAHEYAKKLPFMSNDELNSLEEWGAVAHDLSYKYKWALKRRSLMKEIANKYLSVGLNQKAKSISDEVDTIDPKTSLYIKRKQKERIEFLEKQAKIASARLEAVKSEIQKENAEMAARVNA